ncbi:MAG: tRNA (adenosine(37)-N6)-threonylcarbamoyltransferase complex transferase subunit TsaD [Candidatus Liptonbacteria bacterium]|nr:tRNA (adenosine(37)-N6)-threonylcarbamoyltransferase complex transferase subunit TsaD [Candidatus Liptonbacteria bacterium]
MKILSIETSCDETGIALVDASGGFSNPKFKVIKNLVSSQIKIHRPFGGVVPMLAKREHIRNLPLLWQRIMNNELRIKGKKSIIHNSQFTIQDIDLIAVTIGPGLEPALWTGITFAQELAKKYKKSLIGVNHLEGHLYSFLLQQKRANSKSEIRNPKQKNLEFKISNLEFPAIVLSVSGGHTVLLLMKNLKTWERLGETKDDAAGEAFDKVARMLNLPYPGGPEIEKIAKKGNPEAIAFPRPMMNQKNYDFSFSGLKTSVFYYLRGSSSTNNESITNKRIFVNSKQNLLFADVAASFQRAVIDVLVAKTMRATGEYGARSIILCGGVAANKKLRSEFKKSAKNSGMNFFVPDMKYNNDNAAMIAAAAYMGLSRKKKYKLEANGGLNI